MKWQKVPGKALDITISPDGDVYHLGQNNGIYKWDRGMGWFDTGSSGPTMAGSLGGYVWFQGMVFPKNLVCRNMNTGVQKKEEQPPTRNLLHLSVGSDDTLFAIHNGLGGQGPTGAKGIWRLYPGVGWAPVGNNQPYGTRIAGGNGANPWHVGDHGYIYRWNGDKWANMPGTALDIAVQMIGGHERAWHIGMNEAIYTCDDASGAWVEAPGNGRGRMIAAGGNEVFHVNSKREIYRMV